MKTYAPVLKNQALVNRGKRFDALKCGPGNKPCGKRCIPRKFNCASEQQSSNKKKALAIAAFSGFAGASLGLYYGVPIAAVASIKMGGFSDKKATKDFKTSPKFQPDRIKAPGVEKIGEGFIGAAYLDKENGVIYKQNKSATRIARTALLKNQKFFINNDPILNFIAAHGSTSLSEQNESAGTYIAGELGVGPKLYGKKGNIVGMEYLSGYKTARDTEKAAKGNRAAMSQIKGKTVEAMAKLHLAGVTHNDPHDENVMIKKTGGSYDIKVIDFGTSIIGRYDTAAAEAVSFTRTHLGKSKRHTQASATLQSEVTGNIGNAKKQRDALRAFYESMGIAVPQDRTGARRDSSERYDRKLKCGPGNKPCGSRCIPRRFKCKADAPKGGNSKLKRQVKEVAIFSGRAIAGAAIARAAFKGFGQVEKMGSNLFARNRKPTPAEVVEKGQAKADEAFTKFMVKQLPPGAVTSSSTIEGMRSAAESFINRGQAVQAQAEATAHAAARHADNIQSQKVIKDLHTKAQRSEALVIKAEKKLGAQIDQKTQEIGKLSEDLANEVGQARKLTREVEKLTTDLEKIKSTQKTLMERERTKARSQIEKIQADNDRMVKDLQKGFHSEMMSKLTEQRTLIQQAANEQIERQALLPKGRNKGTLITTPKTGISLRASALNGFPLAPGDVGGVSHNMLNERSARSIRASIATAQKESRDRLNRDFRAEALKIRDSGDTGPRTMWGRYEAAMLVQYRREAVSDDIVKEVRTGYITDLQRLNQSLFTQPHSGEFSAQMLASYDKKSQAIHKKWLKAMKQRHSQINTTIPHNWK